MPDAPDVPEVVKESHPFVMDGAREILSLTSGAIQIEKQIDALESNVVSNPSLAIDIAKALVETACRTILRDRNDVIKKRNPSVRALLTQTLSALQLVKPYREDEADVVKHLRTISKGLVKTFEGLGDLRNSQGFASHGPDGYMDSLDPIQAVFAARAADALVHFLFQAHRRYGGIPERKVSMPSLYELEQKREAVNYQKHSDFNEYIDGLHWPSKIFDLEYTASEVFATIDPEAYLNHLDEYDLSKEDEDEDTESDSDD